MTLGFLGSGKMASALAKGVVASQAVAASDLLCTDIFAPAANALAEATGGRSVATNAELVRSADTIVLCVKPADAVGALGSLRDDLAGKLVISIVAGLPIRTLQDAAGPKARIVRVMPNTPALIGEGAAAFALAASARDADAEVVEKIFGAVGFVCLVKEELLDVVTGLSGSGPAFVYLMIEALADGGVLMGLPRDLSLQLAAQTVAGAARMVRQSGLHPAVLRDQVTSPGGTTVAGLEELEHGGARAAFLAAVRAATERSRELGSGQ